MKKMLEEKKKQIEVVHSIYDTHIYVDWAQKTARNIKEYNFLLSIKDLFDRNLIMTNANLFFDIQSILKTKKPYIHEMTFEELLDYVYTNRIYFDIYYDGFYFFSSSNENLPTDVELKSFIRLHFDPNAKRLTGSSLDKVISWIKEGYCFDSILESLKHYFDHRKMYQDSGVFLEQLTCDDFFELSNNSNFKIFNNSFLIFSKMNETLRKEISNDPILYSHFLNLVQQYIKHHKTEFNLQLFDIAMSKIDIYKNRTMDFISYLTNSIQGFDFDTEVANVTNAAVINKNLKIIISEDNYFIYQIIGYDTLVTFSSPHWCINRSLDQYTRYVDEKTDDFYVILQRYPHSMFNYKSGVTFNRTTRVIKHSFNYGDKPNSDVISKFVRFFKTDSFFSFLKRRKKNDDDLRIEEAPVHAEAMNDAEEEAYEGAPRALILPRY